MTSSNLMDLSNFTLEDLTRPFRDFSRCDSPIEDLFYYDIQKVIPDDATMQRQFECPTALGNFRLDFILELPGRRVGFECDGKDFHESEKDSVRDRAIVDAGHVERIYRLRGYDIHFHVHDAFDLIAARDKEIFSVRGRANIKCLATRECERLDDATYPDTFFSYVTTRHYGRRPKPDLDTESDNYWEEDSEQPKFQKPTIVYWTQKKTRQTI